MFTSKDLCLEHPHYHNGIEYTNSDWDPNSYEFFERLSGTRMEPIASLFTVSIFYCMTYFYEMTRLPRVRLDIRMLYRIHISTFDCFSDIY